MKSFITCALLSLVCTTLPLLTGCGTSDVISHGSGSTTTNGFTVAVVRTNGEPVTGAAIRIRPDDYIAGEGSDETGIGGVRVIDTITGEDGEVTCRNMKPGSYTFEIIDGEHGDGVLIRDVIKEDTINDLGVTTVEPLGNIQGAVSPDLLTGSGELTVEVYGLERLAVVDRETGIFNFTGLPSADYRFRLSSEDPEYEPVEAFAAVTVHPGDTVYVNRFAQWSHSGRLTINPAAAGLGAGDTVFNFPLVVRLHAGNFDFADAKKKGEDLRLTKENGETVHFETEWWDSSGGVAAVWLLCDTLTGDVSAKSYNIYWGNRKASSVSVSSGVFDSTFGYRGVWHLNQSGGKPQLDATAYGNDGTPVGMDGANDVTGLIGRAQKFDDDAQSVIIENVEVFTGDYTVSLWANPDSFSGNVQGVLGADNAFGSLALDSLGQWRYLQSDSTVQLIGTAVEGEWNNLCIVRKNGYSYLYINGTVVDSAVGDTPAADAIVNRTMHIGSVNGSSGWFRGIIDEVRVYTTALSGKWIHADYQTQFPEESVITLEEND